MSTKGMNDPCICNVKCDVTSCTHNNHKKECTAQEITVSSCSQKTDKDATCCETYKANGSMC